MMHPSFYLGKKGGAKVVGVYAEHSRGAGANRAPCRRAGLVKIL